MTGLLCAFLLAASPQVFRERVDLAAYETPDLNLQVRVAVLEIRPTEGTELVVHQEPPLVPDDSLLIFVETTEQRVQVSVRPRRIRRSLDRWIRSLRHFELPESLRHRVVILLPRQVSYGDASIEIGVAEGTVDLGGLAFETLSVDAGVSVLQLDFSEPAPSAGQEMELNAGVGALTVRHLGNARFPYVQVNTGVAAASLDLSGTWPPRARLDASSGLGSVCFHLPRDLGVRVETEGFLVVRNFEPLEHRGTSWVTPRYENAPRHLLLSLGGVLTHYEITYDEEECDDFVD